MQTEANMEKDMCKTTAYVKFQNDGGKMRAKNTTLAVEETMYFRGFPKAFLIFVNQNTHQTQKILKSTSDTVALLLVTWRNQYLPQLAFQ